MIDSHAHVVSEQFNDDRDEVIERAHEAGVIGWIEVSNDLSQMQEVVDFAEQHKDVWASVGIHPEYVDEIKEVDWAMMDKLLKKEKVVAVGEVGLDFYREGVLDNQLPYLEKFTDMAIENDLPVIFHVRDGENVSAHDEVIKFLESRKESQRPLGVIHTFSGNRDQAKKYLEFGLHLSFSGVLTFKNAGEIVKVVKEMPVDRMLIETDCPYLSPEPYRGKRNEPAYVSLVAKKIAELREVDFVDVKRITLENTERLFKLKGHVQNY